MKTKTNGSDIEAKIAGRKFGETRKARNEMICSGCTDTIYIGDRYEHSVTKDQSEELKLCWKCSQK